MSTVRKILFLMVLFLLSYAGSDFRFIIIGDRTGGAVGNIFEEIVAEVNLLKPDFVINIGDLIEGYTEDTIVMVRQWDSILATIKILPCPFYFVPGNHDIQNEKDREIFKAKTNFNRYYSFNYENTHFVILDNTMLEWLFPQEIDREQLEWLKKDLEANKNVENIFVFFHVPTWFYSFENNTPDSLVELFQKYPVKVVFSGHRHTYTYLKKGDIQFINVGSSGGGMETNEFVRGDFYHYLLVTINGKEVNIAVIKRGSVFPPEIVTFDEQQLIKRAEKEAIKITGNEVEEGVTKSLKNFTVTITNSGEDSLIQSLQWDFDSTLYKIAPRQLNLRIGPEEKINLGFNLLVLNGSNIFPIPQFSIAYPFVHGKVCTLKTPLSFKRVYSVKRVRTTPEIDGNLNDVVWKEIKPITNLGSYDGLSLAPVERTEIYVAHDKENLYLAARCFESDFSKLKAVATEQDGPTYTDDNIWFFFDSNSDQKDYCQVIINSNGVVFDRLCTIEDGKSIKDLKWNGPWVVKAGREENAWILEIRIPKKGLAPYNEKEWGFNFRRLQTRIGEGYWSLPFGHDPENFGKILFK